MFTISDENIKKALKCSPDVSVLMNNFYLFCVELSQNLNQMAVAREDSLREKALPASRFLYSVLVTSKKRLEDIFDRLHLINWVHNEFKKIEHRETSWQTSNFSGYWEGFSLLLVNDFHRDIGSFMDSVAHVIIQTILGLDPEKETTDRKQEELRLSTFGQFLKQNDRYRIKIQNKRKKAVKITEEMRANSYLYEFDLLYNKRKVDNMLSIICSAGNQWLEEFLKIRNILTHKEHSKFGSRSPKLGIWVEIYEKRDKPLISNPRFIPAIFKETHALNVENLVDFWLYAAFIIVELLVFLNELGLVLADYREIELPPWRRRNVVRGLSFDFLINQISRLQKTIA